MQESINHLEKEKSDYQMPTISGHIQSLVNDLDSPDQRVREAARLSLVDLGRTAVPSLIQALDNQDVRGRWQAAKALSQMENPAAAPALVNALEDESFGVRWLAAQGLIALRRHGLVPLLQALMRRSESTWLYESALHILRTLSETELRGLTLPVVEALESIEPSIDVPRAAQDALTIVTSTNPEW